jgi:deazaflavin-dependent oxidoreductase (nitroreductase family)
MTPAGSGNARPMTLRGEYEPSPSDWVRDQVEKYESSGGTEGTTLRGVPVVVVTSVGAKSGKLRKNPVMRVEHDGSYALVASKGGAPEHPSWYANLVKNPTVELQDHADKATYTVRELHGEERSSWWSRAVEVWPDYADYQAKTDREIPVFLAERSSEQDQESASA